jgi:hypothetical protein
MRTIKSVRILRTGFCLAALLIVHAGASSHQAKLSPALNSQLKSAAAEQEEFQTIPAKTVYAFTAALNEAGERGYKIESIAPIEPHGSHALTRALSEMRFSAVVKRDPRDQNRFEYEMFHAAGAEELGVGLEDESSRGFQMRFLFRVPFSFRFGRSTMPGVANLVLLERPKSATSRQYEYRVISARPTWLHWKPHRILEQKIGSAAKEGYHPVGMGYISYSLIVVLERGPGYESPKTGEEEYKIIFTQRESSFEKDLNKWTNEGFHLCLRGLGNTALLCRGSGSKVS